MGLRGDQGQRHSRKAGNRRQRWRRQRAGQFSLPHPKQRHRDHLESQFALARDTSAAWRRYRGGHAAVTRRGNYTILFQEQDFGFPYALPKDTTFTRRHPNLMLAVKTKVIQPAFLAGDGRLVIEPLNQTESPRKAWAYRPALRRVVRAPFFAYGLPAPNTDSLRTVDEFELYNGAPDRFEWILHGKRELYIAYNAYRLHGANVGYADILGQSHIEPELARYELHRVWVVEGRLKEGARHVYSRRVFYIDEDSWQIAASDSYDLKGKLWRTAETHAVNYYEVPLHWSTLHVFYDLRARRYLVDGLDNRRTPYRFLETADPREFSPGSLLYYVR